MSGSATFTGVNIVLMLYLFAGSCIYDEMKYVFVDESGTPTIKDSRPFIVAVVIMASFEEVADIDCKISQLKKDNNISQEYEFHFSRNTNKRKNLVIKFLKESKIKYRVFRVEKAEKGDALQEIAEMIVGYLSKNERYSLWLDTNPQLYRALNKTRKEMGAKIKISQTNSRNNNLIQVADYIAGISSMGLKLEKLP